ncbi:MAG: DNA ligase [Firmicutes bacterium]|nr:DNA ligase [Bacillota bacterium]MCL5971716.1 DNA ligase [Bacillota bacterium]
MNRDPAEFIPPMLGVTAKAPFDSEDWWFEVKWDGYRAIISNVSELKIFSRRGENLLKWFPDLAPLGESLPRGTVVDAEVVAWDNGAPSFAALQSRSSMPHLAIAFDCLFSDGQWHLHEPFRRRREYLENLKVKERSALIVSQGVTGNGIDLFQAARAAQLEGVMAKLRSSRYWPGKRVEYWQKFLSMRREWFFVSGIAKLPTGNWQWGLGEEPDGPLVAKVMAPFDWNPELSHGSTRPLRVEVEYRERTKEGRLRHARIRRWRSVGVQGDHGQAPPSDRLS